ncbi:MAG: LacI family transcriptional regulator [Spirochaetaceae bacterium]|jgi:LacI family transcriptional regulator|nr:LacI family transcriptional regulator [Spirochaetaceae bacterium]
MTRDHTIRDVAEAAGVSTATVSRVLAAENADRVSEETRRRVHFAVEALGYRVNHAARSLKTRSSRTVGVIAPELANSFFMDLTEGIEGVLDTEGYTLLLASSSNSVEEEKKRISTFTERMVDGMVIIPAGSSGDHLKTLSERLPVVQVDRFVEGADLDTVVSDNEGGCFELTRALLRDGYTRIGFAGGDITLSTARERLSGYGRALAEAGITPEPGWVCLGGMGIEDGYRRMETILTGKTPPEALVTVNLMVHLGVQRYLLDHPKGKMIIAGFDESLFTPFLPLCRYTAAQDAVEMGRQAGRRIVEKIRHKDGQTGCRIIRLPVTINAH